MGDDHILDFDLTSNRPDALSHRGIAREAALVCGTSLKPSKVALAESGEAAGSLAAVEILDPALCPRYAARVIRGVKVGPSPKWLVDRLESIGQRSVNNIADITNYVMFEMGQPTHAFDLNLLARPANRCATSPRGRATYDARRIRARAFAGDVDDRRQ